MKITQTPLVLLALGLTPLCILPAQEKELIDALTRIDSKGKGNAEAVQVWSAIEKLNASSIPGLLQAMNKANDLGDNWIRAAISEILSRSEKKLPQKQVLSFLENQENLLPRVASFKQVLSDFEQTIKNNDKERLVELLALSKNARDQWMS